RGRGAQRVDRDLDRSVGAVLESDRAREARRELAMGLRLGGARADRAPGDEVRDVLRREEVEEFGAAGNAQLVDLEEQPARLPQALVDGEAAVEARVVDEALPAHGGARLL